MFKNLYGEFKIRKNFDYFIMPLKILYMIFTFPFIIVVILLCVLLMGYDSSCPYQGQMSLLRKVVMHFSAVFVSLIIYLVVLSAILGH